MRTLSLALGLLLLAEVRDAAAQEPPCLTADPSREAELLHRRLMPAMFDNLRMWHPATRSWVEAQETPFNTQSRVYVVHFWSEDCPPCLRELPGFFGLAKALMKKYGNSVKIVYLSESQTAQAAQRYFEANQRQIPAGPQYHDTAAKIRNALMVDSGRSLPMPTTLLLDQTYTVRHAIVGVSEAREFELRSAIDRLMLLPPLKIIDGQQGG